MELSLDAYNIKWKGFIINVESQTILWIRVFYGTTLKYLIYLVVGTSLSGWFLACSASSCSSRLRNRFSRSSFSRLDKYLKKFICRLAYLPLHSGVGCFLLTDWVITLFAVGQLHRINTSNITYLFEAGMYFFFFWPTPHLGLGPFLSPLASSSSRLVREYRS